MKSIEIFAGAGGLALGLESAGIKTIGLVEIDKDACKTLKTNKPQWNVICDDIKNIVKKDLKKLFNIKEKELDLFSGGAPCQSFSYAGKRAGLKDLRGTLFYYYATFLNELKPKMFLFENVKGLLNHDKGKTFEVIKSHFEQQGYLVNYEVLNSFDYSVPQKRERLIMIGIRGDLKDKIKFSFPDKELEKKFLKDVLFDVPESKGAKYSEYKISFFKLIPPGGCWINLPENKAKEYLKKSWFSGGGKRGILRKLSMDEPSLTILTSPQMKQTERCHPIYNRPLNIRESARIQTFPDDWEFCGSLYSQYKQIGNAVPVKLAESLGKSIYKSLKEMK